ncbi:MAG: prolyl oligopeptidase family serine peptidase, partial [Isosphaeraceae bacterium]
RAGPIRVRAEIPSATRKRPFLNHAREAVVQFLGGPPTAMPGNYVAASPVDQVRPGDPPTFLVNGASDPLVPVSQSEELAATLTRAGVPNRLVVIPGRGTISTSRSRLLGACPRIRLSPT